MFLQLANWNIVHHPAIEHSNIAGLHLWLQIYHFSDGLDLQGGRTWRASGNHKKIPEALAQLECVFQALEALR